MELNNLSNKYCKDSFCLKYFLKWTPKVGYQETNILISDPKFVIVLEEGPI